MSSYGSHLSSMYNRMREHLTTQSEDEDPNIRCTFCTRKERVTHFSSIKPGNHISMGGENFLHNMGSHQISVYTHHAIVKDVKPVKNNDSSAVLTLIHFMSTPYDKQLTIRETTELKDLHYDEIYVVRYRHGTHPIEKIISRAESLVRDNVKYSLFSCNCEHFCHWCCVGNESSVQVHNVRETLASILSNVGNIGGKVLKCVTKLVLLSVDDLSSMATGALISVPWGILAGAAIIHLIYCIHKHLQLNKDLREGNICPTCCSRQKSDIWLRFAVYCSTQAGGLGLLNLVITSGVSMGFAAGVMALVGVLTLVLMWAIPRFKKKMCSPFDGKMVRVRSMKNIWIGDVISFDHWGMSHDGIVSAVTIDPGTRNKKGQVKLIHYSLPQLFGRRKVMEDVIEVDLTRDLIKGHDYSGYKVHSPEIVVKRARQRIGETKFGIFSNRSCHFCHWAKIDEDVDDEPAFSPTQEPVLQFEREINMQESLSRFQEINVDHYRGRKHATKTLETKWARIRDDVKEGQVIQFRYKGLPHKAVSTSVDKSHPTQSKISVMVVHYGKERIVTEEVFKFDLKHDDIWIYKYHPLYRFNKHDVVRRARARIGEARYNMWYNRSSHLVAEIVEKDIDRLVSDIDEIKPGDAITFYYWSLQHDAIVTKVNKSESKANNKGNVTIVHYGLENLIAQRTVIEEPIFIDLGRDSVYVKNFDGYITYPADIAIKRARDRRGEQRFSAFGNTSSDLVHWAKVVQSPIIVSTYAVDDTNQMQAGAAEEHLLVPKTGPQYGTFQRVNALTWSDLTPGVIVDFTYYWIWHQGILTMADEVSKKIKVIHYGTDHIFATRTIMEDTLTIDLRHDDIWIYRSHPARSNKPQEIIRKARFRLGEQEWRSGNTSWDFCKACVLKRRTRSLTRN